MTLHPNRGRSLSPGLGPDTDPPPTQVDEKKAADALFLRSLPPYVPDFTKAFDYICVHTGGRAVIDAMEGPARWCTGPPLPLPLPLPFSLTLSLLSL